MTNVINFTTTAYLKFGSPINKKFGKYNIHYDLARKTLIKKPSKKSF